MYLGCHPPRSIQLRYYPFNTIQLRYYPTIHSTLILSVQLRYYSLNSDAIHSTPTLSIRLRYYPFNSDTFHSTPILPRRKTLLMCGHCVSPGTTLLIYCYCVSPRLILLPLALSRGCLLQGTGDINVTELSGGAKVAICVLSCAADKNMVMHHTASHASRVSYRHLTSRLLCYAQFAPNPDHVNCRGNVIT